MLNSCLSFIRQLLNYGVKEGCVLFCLEVLIYLVKWSEWQMLFNVGKCKVMHFDWKNPDYDYFMQTQKLQCTKNGEKPWNHNHQ